MLQPKLLSKVIAVLNENHIDYMVTGSIVSSLQGEPRATHDIDLVINISSVAVKKIPEAFPPPQYYVSASAIEDAVRDKSMFNLLDTNEGDKIDFWILTDEPFDRSRFARKYEEEVFSLKMKVSSPEDTILAKLKWSKLSGGSEKQFTEALRVYEVQYGKLDFHYLENWINQLQLNEFWNKLKQDANPIK